MEDFLEKVIDFCTVDDLIKGYLYDTLHREYICLFCGQIYEEDLIYKNNDQFCTAKKAVENHIKEEHNSSFEFLIGLGKHLTGLSDRQIEIFKILHENNDNKIIADKMETTPATVRSYKFKLREKLRQAKIYEAIFNFIEQSNEERYNFKSDNVRDIALQKKVNCNEKNSNEIGKDNELQFKDIDLNSINLINKKNTPIK